jgi:hypothetical protein
MTARRLAAGNEEPPVDEAVDQNDLHRHQGVGTGVLDEGPQPLNLFAGGRADRTWDKRRAELTRPAVLVLDDFAMRELTAAQADDLYELITERAGNSLILTSNRAPAKAHMFA